MREREWSLRRPALFLSTAVLLASIGCGGRPKEPPAPQPRPGAVVPANSAITLGDIDPDTPARTIRRLQPLADWLAPRLTGFGIHAGRVRVARNIDEMAGLLREGKVDLFLDSPYPTLAVQERAATEILLVRWILGSREYRTLLVTPQDGGLTALDELPGKTVVLLADYSTSGFLLPTALLRQRGWELMRVTRPREAVAAGRVGYFFSHDEENTIELLLESDAIAGAISSQGYEKLPEGLRSRLLVLAETPPVPRQLASVRSDLEAGLTAALKAALLAVGAVENQPVARRAGNDPHWRFDELTAADRERLAELRPLMALLPRE